ncbi:MAG: JAB domain-containing protein [Puniceicoccaceae bacterium]|nr:MAG: JAB domain-containing protein [Puniceicoccaceae bacterium]
MRDLARDERPQEKLERFGPRHLSDRELLAMLIRSGSQGMDVLRVADKLLGESGSLSKLFAWGQDELLSVRGIGKVKALQIVALNEIMTRIHSNPDTPDPAFESPTRVFNHFAPLARGLQVERFWCLCLNRKNRLMRRVEVSSGTASSCLVHPREVFREAIRAGSSGIICVHNHPSGDPSPSSADIQITRQLREAAKTVSVDLLDHVIVGNKVHDPGGLGFYSFREAGLL